MDVNNYLAIEPESSAMIILKPATGYDPQPLPYTCHTHNLFLWDLEAIREGGASANVSSTFLNISTFCFVHASLDNI